MNWLSLIASKDASRWDTISKVKDWETREKINQATEKLDYGCRFVNGKCNTDREWFSGERGCCINCSSAYGYLRAIPLYALDIVKGLYSEKTGFWRKKKGCTLPRKWRSSTCLLYRCDHMTERELYKLLKILE